MNDSDTHALLDAFYEAYASYDTEKLSSMIHEDVCWSISGPVDVFTFCGVHRGKPAVMHLVSEIIPSLYRVFKLKREMALIDGDRASTLYRVTAQLYGKDRVIGYRVAHFMRFKDSKLIELVALIDSFDAAEQMIGHPIDLREDETDAARSDLVFM